MEELKKHELEQAQVEQERQSKLARFQEDDLELAHRMALVDAYYKLKGKISNALIRRKFPELAEYIEDEIE